MRLRSLRTRLTLLFFAVTLVAIGAVLFYVAPQLESSLSEQKLRSIARTARDQTPRISRMVLENGTLRQINGLVAQIDDVTNTRVTVLTVGNGTEGLQVTPFADSTKEVQVDDLRFEVAEVAARTGREARSTESRGDVLLGRGRRADPLRGRRQPRRRLLLAAVGRAGQRRADPPPDPDRRRARAAARARRRVRRSRARSRAA